MSKEKNFHKLIEQQNAEEKDSHWLRVQQDIDVHEDEIQLSNGFTLALGKHKKTIWLVSVFSAVLVVAIGIFLGVWLSRKQSGEPLSRYCAEGDYYTEQINLNLKEYSQQLNSNLLYFDSYDSFEYVDSVYKLKDKDEVICVVEEVVDEVNEYNLTISITDNRTTLQSLSEFELCKNTEAVSAKTVYWFYNYGYAYAKFEHKGYVYYLTVEQAENIEIAFNYIELLLK